MPMGGSPSEEMIEAIIDEKWNELVRDINKVIEMEDQGRFEAHSHGTADN